MKGPGDYLRDGLVHVAIALGLSLDKVFGIEKN